MNTQSVNQLLALLRPATRSTGAPHAPAERGFERHLKAPGQDAAPGGARPPLEPIDRNERDGGPAEFRRLERTDPSAPPDKATRKDPSSKGGETQEATGNPAEDAIVSDKPHHAESATGDSPADVDDPGGPSNAISIHHDPETADETGEGSKTGAAGGDVIFLNDLIVHIVSVAPETTNSNATSDGAPEATVTGDAVAISAVEAADRQPSPAPTAPASVAKASQDVANGTVATPDPEATLETAAHADTDEPPAAAGDRSGQPAVASKEHAGGNTEQTRAAGDDALSDQAADATASPPSEDGDAGSETADGQRKGGAGRVKTAESVASLRSAGPDAPTEPPTEVRVSPAPAAEVRAAGDAAEPQARPASTPTLADRAEAGPKPPGAWLTRRSGGADGGQPTAGSAAEQVRLINRVARAFQSAEARGGEVRLRLSPPELGSLRVSVRLQDGVLHARVEAETEAARQILTQNLPSLRDRLAEQNIRVERFDVELMDRQADSPSDQHRSSSDRDSQGDARQERQAAAANGKMEDQDQRPQASAESWSGAGPLNVMV